MANPQTEAGHVKIANDLWEAIARQNLSGNEFRVLLGIIRKLYGFNKKSDWISNRQLAKLVGISYDQACKMTLRLADRKIITLAYLDEGQRRIVRFNKDYDTWVPLPKKTTLVEIGKGPLPKKAKDPSRKQQTTKATLTKATLTKATLTKATLTKATMADAKKYYAEKLGPELGADMEPVMYDFQHARKTNRLAPSVIIGIVDSWLKFSPGLLREARDVWNEKRYAWEGKRENYFAGILRRLAEEQDARKRGVE